MHTRTNVNTHAGLRTREGAIRPGGPPAANERRVAKGAHPSTGRRDALDEPPEVGPETGPVLPPAAGRCTGEDGSVVAEYGLVAIIGATIASLAVKWATGGAIWQLFDAVMKKVRVLLGA